MSDPRKPDVVTVAVSRVDGGLTILRVITAEYRPTSAEEKAAGMGERAVNWTREATPEYIDSIIAKYDWQGGQRAVSWRIVPDDMLDEATDRTFRNAWKDGGGNKPEVDMPKAREIQRDRLRAVRDPLLAALDLEYMRADESGDQQGKKAIAARKQVLRDVTADPSIEAAATPDELKVAGLSVLNG